MATITVKRGDTFKRTITLLLDGAPVDITPFGIRAQVRDPKGNVLAVLTVTQLEQDGPFLGACEATDPYSDTALWTPGSYFLDVEFTNGADRMSSATVNVKVLGDVTR